MQPKGTAGGCSTREVGMNRATCVVNELLQPQTLYKVQCCRCDAAEYMCADCTALWHSLGGCYLAQLHTLVVQGGKVVAV